MEFFEVKIKRITKEGEEQKVLKESYLVQAVSYTEAETRFAQFMAKLHAEDSFTVLKISTTKYSHLAKHDDIAPEDPFFKVKILSYYKKENSEKMRHHTLMAMIHAKTPADAAGLADVIGDENSEQGWDIIRIERTKVAGVIVMQKKEAE